MNPRQEREPASHWAAPLGSVRSVDHVGITVPRLEEAVELFRELLGAELLYIAGPWSDEAGEWMPAALDVVDQTTLRLAMLRLGPHTNLELLEFAGGPNRPTADLATGGVAHIALHVDDVEAAAQRMRDTGLVRVLAGPTTVGPGEPSAGLRYVYAVTPWGGYLELVSWEGGMPYEQATVERMLPPAPSWSWRPEHDLN